MTASFVLDRSLPVPLSVQLRGKIKYGITCGELTAGDRLPSVREMAAQIGIAPMTVAAVYRELQMAELLEARPGSGTFVAPGQVPDAHRQRALQRLQSQIDALLRSAGALGLDAGAVMTLVNIRSERTPQAGALRLVLIGLFDAATADYAVAIQAQLPAGDSVSATTIDRLRTDPAAYLQACMADLVLTLADRRSEVAALLGPDAPPMTTVSFLPAEHVRARLAGLDPFRRVAVVSLFPDWLPIMAAGVQRFAPHVAQISAAVAGTREMHAILADVDVVVYATGAESVVRELPEDVAAVEYRHFPDPGDVERTLLPMIEQLRHRPGSLKTGEDLCE